MTSRANLRHVGGNACAENLHQVWYDERGESGFIARGGLWRWGLKHWSPFCYVYSSLFSPVLLFLARLTSGILKPRLRDTVHRVGEEQTAWSEAIGGGGLGIPCQYSPLAVNFGHIHKHTPFPCDLFRSKFVPLYLCKYIEPFLHIVAIENVFVEKMKRIRMIDLFACL